MCGLACVFCQKGIDQSDIGTVERMNNLQRHRGPDDEGIYFDNWCVLGHRRLAIIDLSKDGHEPFASDDHRFQLVYNGEIYNYLELRDELKQLGWQFTTKTDTEVLLKAFLHYGAACLPKLNGMFAFAIYDAEQKSLFLARDRMGIKPLYYAEKDCKLYFASEIKAFKAVLGLTSTLNYQSLFDYLIFNRTDIYDETFLNEIKRIPKGCYATLNADGFKISEWWHPGDYLKQHPIEDLAEITNTVRDILVSSVQLRMRSDVAVGSCLSGGLDSSILVGILYSHHGAGRDYPTFTASFPGHPLDETSFVDALNRKYPFKNLRIFPVAQGCYDSLEEFVYTNDEPTTSFTFYSQYEVMRLARDFGVTVLLDGQGGDENFAGYHYFHGFALYGLLRKRKVLEFARELSKDLLKKQDRSAYQTLLFQILPDTMRKRLLLRTVPYLQPDFFLEHVNKSLILNEFFNVEGLNSSLVRHFQYKLEHLLRMEDRNSMAFSMEARVPYLDYRLVEYLLGVSENLKIRGGRTKYLQQMALGHYTIPEILGRTDKIGFGTPGEEWMLTEPWKRLTMESYMDVAGAYPEVFKKEARLPEKGLDHWKINQLSIWRKIFLS